MTPEPRRIRTMRFPFVSPESGEVALAWPPGEGYEFIDATVTYPDGDPRVPFGWGNDGQPYRALLTYPDGRTEPALVMASFHLQHVYAHSFCDEVPDEIVRLWAYTRDDVAELARKGELWKMPL